MKFFIDTANLDEIREAAALGVIDGVTTNPTLISKEEGGFEEIIGGICEVVDGPVSVEVTSLDSKGMVEEGRRLSGLHRNVVIKVPIGPEGLKAAKALEAEGVRANVTLVFSPSQALLAAKAGASFVSPFVGRLDDINQPGMEVVRQILAIYGNYDFSTQVIVASIRSPLHVLEAALAGAHIATIPFGVIQQLLKHPLTDIGLERFLDDWRRWREKGREV